MVMIMFGLTIIGIISMHLNLKLTNKFIIDHIIITKLAIVAYMARRVEVITEHTKLEVIPETIEVEVEPFSEEDIETLLVIIIG